MITVNLLPDDLRPVTRTPVPYMVSGLVLVLTLGAIGVLFANSTAAVMREKDTLAGWQEQLDVQLAQYDSEETGFDNIVEEYNALEQQKLDLAEKDRHYSRDRE